MEGKCSSVCDIAIFNYGDQPLDIELSHGEKSIQNYFLSIINSLQCTLEAICTSMCVSLQAC